MLDLFSEKLGALTGGLCTRTKTGIRRHQIPQVLKFLSLLDLQVQARL
jgi:hypothetical protein